MCWKAIAVSEKHQRQNYVFGRIWKVWFRVVQQSCSDESRIQLHADAPERCVQSSGEKYNSECLSTTVKHGGRGVMVWGAFSAAGTNVLLPCEKLWNTGEYCRKAGFPQSKSCVLKRNNQMLFFNKTVLLPTLQRPWEQVSQAHVLTQSVSRFQPYRNIWSHIKHKLTGKHV